MYVIRLEDEEKMKKTLFDAKYVSLSLMDVDSGYSN